MTGEEFREGRLSLGLSFREAAIALELGTTGSGVRKIRRFEHLGPPEKVAADMARLLAGYRPPWYPRTSRGRAVEEVPGD